MSHRTRRVAHLIQREISNILLTEVSDPRLTFITVTDVKVTPDLRNATIFYSMIGTDEEKKDVAKAFRKASGYIQRMVTESLSLKFAPHFVFKFDDTMEKAAEMEEVIDSISDEPDSDTIPKEEDDG